MKKNNILFLLAFITLGFSCQNSNYTPKPLAYPRIEFPTKSKYTLLNEENCNYQFEVPDYTELERDSFFFEEVIQGNCWVNIIYPTLNGTIHLSYKEIGTDITLEKVLEDSHELTYTHSKQADYIDELSIKNKYGVEGLMFEVGGDAATNMQFYLSDFETHYLRGALYFRASPNADSIAPVIDFVRADMMHLFETFQWK